MIVGPHSPNIQYIGLTMSPPRLLLRILPSFLNEKDLYPCFSRKRNNYKYNTKLCAKGVSEVKLWFLPKI